MWNKGICPTPCIITVAICASLGAQDPDGWPQFRGPNATGVAQSGEYVAEFSETNNLFWKTPLPSGISSPCVWGDRVFLTAHDIDRSALETICIDRNSGAILWRKDAPAKLIEKVHEASSPANATPATDGQHIFVYFESCGLQAFDFDGNQVWYRDLPPVVTRFGSGTSPIVVDGKVILNREAGMRSPEAGQNAPVPGKLFAFDTATGKEIWTADRPRGFSRYTTPVVWRNNDSAQVLVLGSTRLTSYDLATGKELWFASKLPPQVCATPLIHQSVVYVTATGMFGEPETLVELPAFAEMIAQHDADKDGLLGLAEIPDELLIIDRRASDGAGNSKLKDFIGSADSDGDEKIAEVEWTGFSKSFVSFIKNIEPGVFAMNIGGTGDMTGRNLVWKNPRGVTEVPSLLFFEGKIFLVRNGGIVHCRQAGNGEDIYMDRLDSPGGYYASPVAGDGKVYFASDRGVVTVIDGRSSELKVLATNDLGAPIKATPALVDGVIYVRTDSGLYAFGKPR